MISHIAYVYDRHTRDRSALSLLVVDADVIRPNDDLDVAAALSLQTLPSSQHHTRHTYVIPSLHNVTDTQKYRGLTLH